MESIGDYRIEDPAGFDAERQSNLDDLSDAEKVKWNCIGVVGACLDFGHNEQLDELHRASAADVRCLSRALDVYADALELVVAAREKLED